MAKHHQRSTTSDSIVALSSIASTTTTLQRRRLSTLPIEQNHSPLAKSATVGEDSTSQQPSSTDETTIRSSSPANSLTPSLPAMNSFILPCSSHQSLMDILKPIPRYL